MKKSNRKGFTLVELVVVIAIIGILAAILVPTMMNYVKKSRLKSANSNAKLVFTTVNNQAADIIAEGGATTDIVSAAAYKPQASDTGALKEAVYKALKDNGDGVGYVLWDVDANLNVTKAQWAAGTGTGIVGQYPDPESDPDKTHKIGDTF